MSRTSTTSRKSHTVRERLPLPRQADYDLDSLVMDDEFDVGAGIWDVTDRRSTWGAPRYYC